MSDALLDYLASYPDAVEQAALRQPIQERYLQIAGLTFRLRIVGSALAEATLPALAHLVTEATSTPPDITFYLCDGTATGVWPPRPPFTPDAYRRYGQRALTHDGVRSLMHAPTSGQLFAYDRASRQGYFWVEDASQLSIYERAAPVQTLFHWALAEFGWQIVHAAAVGNATGGVLLIGNTGAGKSTTALSCLAQDGLHFLSDDKCLVQLEPTPQAFALFSSAKIKGDMLPRLPHFRPLLAGWDNNYKAEKGLVFLHPTFADHMITSFPVKALLLPQVAHRSEAAIHPAAPGDVFRQLGPSTVIWLPGAEAENYRFTAAMTRHLPCYRIELASDPQVNVDAIRRLLTSYLTGSPPK
ncbi:MAG: hypothetical protein EOM24_06670 [Chloroflexia bacterium]|nr:hypothetical protein [Chloroflexia bacterium]